MKPRQVITNRLDVVLVNRSEITKHSKQRIVRRRTLALELSRRRLHALSSRQRQLATVTQRVEIVFLLEDPPVNFVAANFLAEFCWFTSFPSTFLDPDAALFVHQLLSPQKAPEDLAQENGVGRKHRRMSVRIQEL